MGIGRMQTVRTEMRKRLGTPGIFVLVLCAVRLICIDVPRILSEEGAGGGGNLGTACPLAVLLMVLFTRGEMKGTLLFLMIVLGTADMASSGLGLYTIASAYERGEGYGLIRVGATTDFMNATLMKELVPKILFWTMCFLVLSWPYLERFRKTGKS